MLRILLLVSLLLPGCKYLKDAPVDFIYVIDTDHEICAKRKITNKETLASQWVEDLPLSECDGNVSLTMKDFLNLRTYIKNNKE